jgi:hypothetical protein
MRSRPWLLLLAIVVVAFVINLIWENIQIHLYQGYDTFSERFIRCLPAAGGDALIILLLYALVVWWRQEWWWLGKAQLSDWALVVSGGVGIAITIELVALATDRWAYTPSMPRLFNTSLGVWPIIQMIVLPLATFAIVRRLFHLKAEVV